MKTTLLLAGALATCALSNFASSQSLTGPSDPAAGDRWWHDIAVLAGKEFAGRETGSPGYLGAARYVADQLKSYGLEPLGTDGYFQPVRFKVQRVIAPQSSLAIVTGQGSHTVQFGADYIPGARMPQPRSVDSPLVFIGYGLHLPRLGIDDFRGIDLRGKVGVYINGGPDGLEPNVRAHARNAEMWAAAERAGAVGLIMIPVPGAADVPWSRQAVIGLQPGMYPADPASQLTSRPMLGGIFNPESAEMLFAHSGHTFASIAARAAGHQALEVFALNANIRAHITTEVLDAVSPNLVAKLPGSDTELGKQYVVVSAHLDHLGVDATSGGERIYPGAMDDASGVASVLEVARELSISRARPRRSVLFLTVTAEEKGLFGSRYFTLHPTVPRGAVVADINMDMPLPLWPLHAVMVSGLTESTLGESAHTVATRLGYDVMADPHPERFFFIRTDQYSFVRSGIPAVALSFGAVPGSPEEQIQKQWLTTRYHSPADNLEQPVDRAAAGAFNTYIAALTREVADSNSIPTWLPTSYFRELAR